MDRCDACTARARYVAVLTAGLLMFCAHHFHLSEAGLLLAGAQVRDLGEDTQPEAHSAPTTTW